MPTEFACLCGCFLYDCHITSLKDFVMSASRIDVINTS